MRFMFRFLITTLLTFTFIFAPLAMGLDVSGELTLSPEVVHAQGEGTVVDSDETKSPQGEDDGWFGIPTFDSLLARLGNAVLSLFGNILGISGTALNASLSITVFDFGALMDEGGQEGITTAWSLLRDIANIAFIGILVFIGIATILQIEGYGYQKLLVRVIIAALLVNFSLFFTQIVIDGTNLMAAETYQMITAGECDEFSIDSGISCRFMEEFNLTSIYNTDTGVSGSILGEQSAWNIFIITTLGSVFFLIAAFVFLAAALMLVSRFVVLMFLMIISPLAFAAFVLPKTAPQASKWWSTLISQGLFAPFFLLFVWASLEVIDGIGSALSDRLGTGDASFAAALSNAGVDTAGIFINFAIVAGLLIASLIMAKRLGIGGAESAITYGKDIGGRALGGAGRAFGGATFGAAGRFTQRLVGRGGRGLTQSEGLQKAATRNDMGGFAARQTMRGAQGASRSSFDLRNVGGGAVGKATRTGSGLSGGYQQTVEEGAKRKAEFAKESFSTPGQRRKYAQTLKQQASKGVQGAIGAVTGGADINKEGAEKVRKDIAKSKDKSQKIIDRLAEQVKQ